MVLKDPPARPKASHKKEHLDAEAFFVEVQEQNRKNWAMYLATFFGVVFASILLLQALGYAHLQPELIYAIVAGMVTTVTIVIRAVWKRK